MSQVAVELPEYVIKQAGEDSTYHKRLNHNSILPACLARLHNVDEDTDWALCHSVRVTDVEDLCGNPECFGTSH